MKAIFMIFILLASTCVLSALATIEDDEKECADQLASLAACLPFVGGTAKHPTKECCDDTEKVRAAKPKCLCVLIKESTDPSLGLPINTTLALQMPTACNSDAKVSDCPTILKLPADSPDAKIFKVAGADSDTGGETTTTNSPKDSTASTKSPSSSSSTATNSDTRSASSTTSSSSNGAKITSSGMILVVMGLASVAF